MMFKKYIIFKEINKPIKGDLWSGSFNDLEEAKKALQKAQKKEPNETFKIYEASYSKIEI